MNEAILVALAERVGRERGGLRLGRLGFLTGEKLVDLRSS